MTRADLYIPVTVSAALVAGMVLALLASFQGPLLRQLGGRDNRSLGLLALLDFVLVPMSLVSGLLVDQWGVQENLIVGALVLALGLAVLAGSQTRLRAGTGVLLMGAGGACLATGCCVLMPQAFFGLGPLAATFLGTLFLSLGVLGTPLLAERLIPRYGVRQCLLGIALVPLIPGMLAVFLPVAAPHRPLDVLEHPLSSPVLWLAALALLLYFPLEHLMAVRSSQHLAQLSQRPEAASAWLVWFWMGFLAARAVGALFLAQATLVPEPPEPWMVLVLAVFLAIVLGNLAGTVNPRSARWGPLLLGLGLGPIWPAFLALVFRQFPDEQGVACGTLWAFGMLGSLMLTRLIGSATPSSRTSKPLRVPMALTLVLAGIALVLVLVA